MPPESYPLLGTVAVQSGVLNETELDEVLRKAAERGVALGEMLFKLGYVSRDRLLELLAEQYRTTVYDLTDWRPEPELVDVLPHEFVQEYGFLPVSLSHGRLVLAAAGPFSTPLGDLVDHVAELTGCRVEVVICDPEALRRYLAEFFAGAAPAGSGSDSAPAAEAPSDFTSLIDEIRAEADAPPRSSDATALAELDEVLDRAFGALMESRAHEFLNAVMANTNTAAELLDKAKQYQHMGLPTEALTLAHRADRQLLAALRKANELEQAWGPLLQHVELLRTRLTQLDAEDAADFAPQEMGRLAEIRKAMHECIETKAVEQLRALVDEGQLLVERIGALSPRHNRRERLIESLNHVREVLARARRLGAQTVAPQAVEAAYRLLDDADTRARENAWDLVQDALAQALAHAEAAEKQAIDYAEGQRDAQAELRVLCDTMDETLRELAEHPAVQSILPDLMSALRDLTRARQAAENGDEVATHVQKLATLRETTLPTLRRAADNAHAEWADLGWAIDAAATATRDGVQRTLSGEAAIAANTAADDLVAFFRALNDRNLSQAQSVVQEAEQRLTAFWDVSGRSPEERNQLGARFVDTAGELARASARIVGPDMRDTIATLRSDLDRAGAAMAEDNFGDATALLDGVDRGIAEDLLPAADRGDSDRRDVLAGLAPCTAALADLAGGDAATLAPGTYPAFVGVVEHALDATRDGDIDAVAAACKEARAAERAVRADMDAALTARAEAITRRLTDVEAQLQHTVNAAPGQGAPEMLEEGYFELNSARALLEEQTGVMRADVAAQIEMHLRAAELTMQQVKSAGVHERRRLDALNEQLQTELQTLEAELNELLTLPSLGLDHPALQDANDAVTDAITAVAGGDLPRGFDLARQARQHLDSVRGERDIAGARRKELDTFFQTTLPEHVAALDGPLLETAAPEAWGQLHAIAAAATEAREVDDVPTLIALQREAGVLLGTCAAQERVERSRLLVDVYQAQAAAAAALRLAALVQAPAESPDLYAAATQLQLAGENAAQARAWTEAQDHFRAAATRAGQAQEAALQAARQARIAQEDLLRAAADHMARGDVDAARAALDAADATTQRAALPEPDTGGLTPVPDLGALDPADRTL